MPSKKSLTALLKEFKEKYGDLSIEEATKQISLEKAQLHENVEELKALYGSAEKKKKGAITTRRNGVEAKIAALDKYVGTLSQPQTLPAGASSGSITPPVTNVPTPPKTLPTRAMSAQPPPPASNIPVPPKTNPTGDASPKNVPPNAIPVGDASSKNVPPKTIPAGAVSLKTAPPNTVPAGDASPKNIPPNAIPAGDASSGNVPSKTIPAGAVSLKTAPPNAVPAGDASPKNVPPNAIPVGDASLKNVPPKTIPAGAASLKTAPPNAVPAGAASLKTAPPNAVPAGDASPKNVPPKTVPAGAVSSKAAPPNTNVPVPPNIIPTGDAASQTTPPNIVPAGDAASKIAPPKTIPTGAVSSKAALPNTIVPVLPNIVPVGAPSPGSIPPDSKAPIIAAGSRGDDTSQSSRPKARPIARKKKDGSKSSPLVIGDDDVKPIVPPKTVVDPNMGSGGNMQLLTPEQREAMVKMLRETAGAGEGGPSGRKRKNASGEGERKKRKAAKQQEEDGGAPSASRKRNRGESGGGSEGKPSKKAKLAKGDAAMTVRTKAKGKGREEPRTQVGPGGIVATMGEGGEGGTDSADDALGLGGGGTKEVRKRAEKEQKTCWIFVILPAKILPGGEIERYRIRVLVPVDESETQRARFNRQGWTEVHNYTVAGLNVSCAVLSRAKQFRWFCREIGAVSRMLIWSLFINRNKRSRCHFHALTDRASSHNDVEPKISRTTQEPAHIVTSVGLPQDDTLLIGGDVLNMWTNFKTKGCNYELAGARDSAEKIPLTIGNMTEANLLSFFRVKNGRHYLGCGCDLHHATFDFFLWKVAPPLFSETVTGSAECIGTPWDVRLRPTFVTIFSSMGLGPDNLDTVMKYNIRGEKNDLSSAPQFIRDFWTLNQALKSAEWSKVGPPTPPRRRERPIPQFVDPEDIKHGEVVTDSESDEEEPPLPRAKTFATLNLSESEEEQEDPNGELGGSGLGEQKGGASVGNDGEQRGKEGEAPIDQLLQDLVDPSNESDVDVDPDTDINTLLRPANGRRPSTPLSSPPSSPPC